MTRSCFLCLIIGQGDVAPKSLRISGCPLPGRGTLSFRVPQIRQARQLESLCGTEVVLEEPLAVANIINGVHMITFLFLVVNSARYLVDATRQFHRSNRADKPISRPVSYHDTCNNTMKLILPDAKQGRRVIRQTLRFAHSRYHRTFSNQRTADVCRTVPSVIMFSAFSASNANTPCFFVPERTFKLPASFAYVRTVFMLTSGSLSAPLLCAP